MEPETVVFRCNCARERVEQNLIAMGETDINSLVDREGQVKVTCEFCARDYRFDRIDMDAVFVAATQRSGSTTHHYIWVEHQSSL